MHSFPQYPQQPGEPVGGYQQFVPSTSGVPPLKYEQMPPSAGSGGQPASAPQYQMQQQQPLGSGSSSPYESTPAPARPLRAPPGVYTMTPQGPVAQGQNAGPDGPVPAFSQQASNTQSQQPQAYSQPLPPNTLPGMPSLPARPSSGLYTSQSMPMPAPNANTMPGGYPAGFPPGPPATSQFNSTSSMPNASPTVSSGSYASNNSLLTRGLAQAGSGTPALYGGSGTVGGEALRQQQQRAEEAEGQSLKVARQFWDAVDICGWTGSVAGSIMFLLTQELWLAFLPLIMPLVALYASREKEKIDFKDAQRVAFKQYDSYMGQQYRQETSAMSQEVARLNSSLRDGISQTASALNRLQNMSGELQSMESRLGHIEGNMRQTSAATLDAVQQIAAHSSSLVRDNSTQFQALKMQVVADVRAEVARINPGNNPQLNKLDSRLAALEAGLADLDTGLSGLEHSTADALKTLGNAMHATVSEVLSQRDGVDGEALSQQLQQTVGQVVDRKISASIQQLEKQVGDAVGSRMEGLRSTMGKQLEVLGVEVVSNMAAMQNQLQGIDKNLAVAARESQQAAVAATNVAAQVRGSEAARREEAEKLAADITAKVQETLDKADAALAGRLQQSATQLDQQLLVMQGSMQNMQSSIGSAVDGLQDGLQAAVSIGVQTGLEGALEGTVEGLEGRLGERLDGGIASLGERMVGLQEDMQGQLSKMEGVLDNVIEVCDVIEETIALRSEAVAARSEELDKAVQQALGPLLHTMQEVRDGVSGQGSQLNKALPALALGLQQTNKEVKIMVDQQTKLAEQLQSSGNVDAAFAVGEVLKPYKAALAELETAVGSQGGLLSTLLPSIVDGMAKVQEAVQDIAEEQGKLLKEQDSLKGSLSSVQAPSSDALDEEKLVKVVETALKPYKAMVEGLQSAVGSQGGQLSTLLPSLADDVEKMRRQLHEQLEQQQQQVSLGDSGPAPQGLQAGDVERIVNQVLAPYNDMLRSLQSQLERQGKEVGRLVPSIRQEVREALKGLPQREGSPPVDPVELRRDIEGVVEAALRPYKGMIEGLQVAVGSQGGQLSSTLPSLVTELQRMGEELKGVLELQAANFGSDETVATTSITAEDLSEVLQPVMETVSRLARQVDELTSSSSSGAVAAPPVLEQEVVQVTKAVQDLNEQMQAMSADISSIRQAVIVESAVAELALQQAGQAALQEAALKDAALQELKQLQDRVEQGKAVGSSFTAAPSDYNEAAPMNGQRPPPSPDVPRFVPQWEPKQGVVGSSFEGSYVDIPSASQQSAGWRRAQGSSQVGKVVGAAAAAAAAGVGVPVRRFARAAGSDSPSAVGSSFEDVTGEEDAAQGNSASRSVPGIPQQRRGSPPEEAVGSSFEDAWSPTVPLSSDTAEEYSRTPGNRAAAVSTGQDGQTGGGSGDGSSAAPVDNPMFEDDDAEKAALRELISRKVPNKVEQGRTYEQAEDWFKYAAMDDVEGAEVAAAEDVDEMDEAEASWTLRPSEPSKPPSVYPPPEPVEAAPSPEQVGGAEQEAADQDGRTDKQDAAAEELQESVQRAAAAAAEASDRFLTAAREQAARAAEEAARIAAGPPGSPMDPTRQAIDFWGYSPIADEWRRQQQYRPPGSPGPPGGVPAVPAFPPGPPLAPNPPQQPLYDAWGRPIMTPPSNPSVAPASDPWQAAAASELAAGWGNDGGDRISLPRSSSSGVPGSSEEHGQSRGGNGAGPPVDPGSFIMISLP